MNSNLIIDEFQTIEKLEALERILSESAKYGLLMGLAHQNMAQLSRRELLQGILANVGLIVSFKVSSDDAAVLARVFGEEWKTVLCERLRRFEVVTKRTLDDWGSEVVRSMTSLAPPPVHTVEELKDFMSVRMNGLYDWAREDRKPVYKDEQERMENVKPKQEWNSQRQSQDEQQAPLIVHKPQVEAGGGRAQPILGSQESAAGKRSGPVQLETAISEIVRGLKDERHRQEDGEYRIPFAEIWRKLKEWYGLPNDSDKLVGPNGKVISAATVGRMLKDRLSGEAVIWWEGGRAVRGYLWKGKIGTDQGARE